MPALRTQKGWSRSNSIKPTADKDVLAVEWQELRSTPAGKQLYHYIGDFTIKVHKVDEVADIYANPYQLAVVHYTKVPVNG